MGHDSRRDRDEKRRDYLRFSSAGIEFCIFIALGVAAGLWLDDKTGLSPLFLILGAFSGFAGATYNLYKQLFSR